MMSAGDHANGELFKVEELSLHHNLCQLPSGPLDYYCYTFVSIINNVDYISCL